MYLLWKKTVEGQTLPSKKQNLQQLWSNGKASARGSAEACAGANARVSDEQICEGLKDDILDVVDDVSLSFSERGCKGSRLDDKLMCSCSEQQFESYMK